MTLPAYIYARFSSMEQSKGDSLKRQLEGGRECIKQQNWLYAPEREIVDEGRSAFHGDNRTEGSEFHEFDRKAREGHFANGAALVVENLDRLTRQGYEEAFEIVRGLTRHGVTVATWSPAHVYVAHARIDMAQAMRLILESELAHEESSKKSGRLKKAWKTKIEDAQAGDRRALTKVVPGWLTVDPTTREITPIPHRVAVLNQIYNWYIEGKGLPWIERTLNERKEPTWGRGKHGISKGWNVATLHKYLTSRTVLGEYQPKARVGVDAKVSKGIVIADYYPQVIRPDKFNRVQAVRKDRRGFGGRSQFSLPNLFTGIASCAHCDGRLHFATQKAGKTRNYKRANGSIHVHHQTEDRSYLRCKNALRSYNCDNHKGHRYETLEKAVLDTLFDLASKASTFEPSCAAALLITRVAEQERVIALKRQQMNLIMENLMTVHSKALAQKVADIEAELDADEEVLEQTKQALQIEKGSARPEDNMVALLDARQALSSEDEEQRYHARAATRQSLKQLIELMALTKQGETHITLKSSSVHIIIQPDGSTGAIIYQGPDGQDDWHPDEEQAAE